MRGQRRLFNDIITPVIEIQKSTGFGRNKVLMANRDTCMMYRYYFYVSILRKNYQDAIAIVSQQFFLSEIRVVECMQDNTELRHRIFKEKLSVKELKQRFDWLIWQE
jgi:hypothetical protein